MVKRTYDLPEEEREQSSFQKPSEREHLFQVVDVYDSTNAPGKMVLDDNTVCAKLEVIGGEEEGRTMLNRLSLDQDWKGFFATRLFLKAIGESYKGTGLEVDTDRWIGRQFYATVIHAGDNKQYANIDEYNFEKVIKPNYASPVTNAEDIKWEE